MSAIDDLLNTIARLRAPDGCPWDKVQTHESLRPYLVEEAAEVLDAIERKAVKDMEEELGDLLLQVLLHAQIANENRHFSFESICQVLNEKLIRRHPHVFGTAQANTTDEVLQNWNAIKSAEKETKQKKVSALEELQSLPPPLSGLAYASKISGRLRKMNRSADLEKAMLPHEPRGETSERTIAAQLLFLADLAKTSSIDADSALRTYCSDLIHRLGK